MLLHNGERWPGPTISQDKVIPRNRPVNGGVSNENFAAWWWV